MTTETILNSYVYKDVLIWKFEEGYRVEDTPAGTLFPTLKKAKEYITSVV